MRNISSAPRSSPVKCILIEESEGVRDVVVFRERRMKMTKCECCKKEFLRRQVREIKGEFYCRDCLRLLAFLAVEVRPVVVEVRKGK